MASRSTLFQKWLRDRETALAAKQSHRGQRLANRRFIKTTATLLRDDLNRRQIAPARAAKAARREAGQPSLFGDMS